MNTDRAEAATGLISVVAPAYNEAGGLTEFVHRIDAVMRDHGIDHEIVVVNDGSTDHSLLVMQSLRAVTPTSPSSTSAVISARKRP